MIRRDFIKALPLFIAAPEFLIGSEKKSLSRHLVVLGSSSSKFLANYGGNFEFNTYTLVNDTEPRSCSVNFDYFPFSPPDSAIMKFGDFRVQKPDNLPELKINPDLKSALQQKSGIITVVAGLGNVSGTMLYQAIGTQLGKKLKDIRMVGTVPFRFEGIRRRNNAFKAIRSVNGKAPQTILYLDSIRDIHGNLSIKSAFAKVDDWILKTLATDPI